MFMPFFIKKRLDVRDEDIVRTRNLEDAREQARRFAASGVNPIIVCGGDGILNAVINGTLDVSSDVSIGYIPAGMTNVAAIAIGIPQNFKLAVETIKNGYTRKIDAGKITLPSESRYFISMADIGLAADLVRLAESNALIKRIFGKTAYSFAGIYKFLAKKYYFDVAHESGSYKSFNLICSNGKFWGGKFFWHKNISISDGSPDIFIFESMSIVRLLTVFLMFALHKKIREPRHLRGGKITVTARRKVPWQLDGEFMGWTKKATLEVVPKAVKFICRRKKNKDPEKAETQI